MYCMFTVYRSYVWCQIFKTHKLRGFRGFASTRDILLSKFFSVALVWATSVHLLHVLYGAKFSKHINFTDFVVL